jgi:tetratricopeptide (TPR) repeat protein
MAGTILAFAPAWGAQAEWLLGYPEQGLALGNDALALAERLAHPFSLAHALQWQSVLHLNRGEPELALQQLEAMEALVAEQRLGFVTEPQLLRGAALTAQGAFEEAIACLRKGVCTENLKSDYSGDEVRQGWRVNE